MPKQCVVDQNFLREPNPALHRYLVKGNFVVLTDYACMEAYKGDSLLNLRRSLEIVSRYPAQLIVLKGTADAIRLTYKPMARIRTNMIDVEQTQSIGDFCRIIYSMTAEERDPYYRDLREKSQAANAFFSERLVDAEKILEATRLTEQDFSPDQLKQIRNEEYSAELMDKIVRAIMTTTAMLLAKNNLPDKGFSLVENCYLFRYAAACFFLGVRWISRGGYQSVNLKRFQNDIIDMTYAAYATYFDGLLTKDKKLKELYRLLDVLIGHI